MSDDHPKPELRLKPLPEYEMKLLVALAAFLGRETTPQAAACLAMYLRQSCDRILTQCEYYGHQWQMDKWEVLNYIYNQPEEARQRIATSGRVHHFDEPDVFTQTS
jgi:hypothetical protein